MRLPSLVEDVAGYIHTGPEEAKVAVRAFADEMTKKHKTWEDEGDMIAHLMDWCLKRWLGAKSRRQAESMAIDQRERREHLQQAEQEKPDEQKLYAEMGEWIRGAIRSESIRKALDGKVRGGWLLDDAVHARAKAWLDYHPEDARQLEKTIGYDIMRQQVLKL